MQPKHIGALCGAFFSILGTTLSFSAKYVESSQNVFFIVFQMIVFAVIGSFIVDAFDEKEVSIKKHKDEGKKK